MLRIATAFLVNAEIMTSRDFANTELLFTNGHPLDCSPGHLILPKFCFQRDQTKSPFDSQPLCAAGIHFDMVSCDYTSSFKQNYSETPTSKSYSWQASEKVDGHMTEGMWACERNSPLASHLLPLSLSNWQDDT